MPAQAVCAANRKDLSCRRQVEVCSRHDPFDVGFQGLRRLLCQSYLDCGHPLPHQADISLADHCADRRAMLGKDIAEQFPLLDKPAGQIAGVDQDKVPLGRTVNQQLR